MLQNYAAHQYYSAKSEYVFQIPFRLVLTRRFFNAGILVRMNAFSMACFAKQIGHLKPE